MNMGSVLALASAATACGGGGGGSPSGDAPVAHDAPFIRDEGVSIDAPVAHDSSVAADAPVHAKAVSVTCPASPANVVASSDDNNVSFTPDMTAITSGQVVEFLMADSHDAESTDGGGIDVPFGGSACYQFPSAGTWDFRCTNHNFSGSIVVSN